MPGLPTAASMVLASIRMSAASGTMANEAGARLFRGEIGQFAGRNQNVRHGRPLLCCGWKLGSIRNPFDRSAICEHFAELFGCGGHDGDEVGFAKPALGAMALQVSAGPAVKH